MSATTRIPLPRNLAVRAYEQGWELVEVRTFASGKQKGEQYDYNLGYFGRLGTALEAACDTSMRKSGAQDVKELLKELEEFKKALKEVFKVELRFDVGAVT